MCYGLWKPGKHSITHMYSEYFCHLLKLPVVIHIVKADIWIMRMFFLSVSSQNVHMVPSTRSPMISVFVRSTLSLLYGKMLQGCLLGTHQTSIMWFVFPWLLHAPVCNCACYKQTLMSRALLSCTTLACEVLERLSLYWCIYFALPLTIK